ncbi:cutinase-domain-containing protein [Podospora australis]|uniref:Cutinase n=1 Tax=Podospora australis TaxID=1536484 RepID=A0AAN7AL13_9PEZI|nr:cutinase-domain-containing protein [Podospora australis]
MKSFIATILLAALAAAKPVEVSSRQILGRVGSTATEFTDDGCKDIIMLFARGSTEIGNMGTVCGPPTANGLKDVFGRDAVAVEGIKYEALLSTNFLPGGADLLGIREMKRLIAKATTQCPNSKLVVGGYSQGAALTHRAVEDLPQAQKDKIVAAFTFGDTKNQQDNGQIPNFPREKTIIICNVGDLVCSGTLTILAPHLDYSRRAPEAVNFISARLQAAGVRPKA